MRALGRCVAPLARGIAGIRSVASAAASAGGGQLCTFGNGDFGRLGHGPDDVRNKEEARPVGGLVGDIKQVACGGAHNLVLTRDGQVFSFGLNDHGQLGLGKGAGGFVATPTEVKGIEGSAVSIAAGHHHSFVITDDGEVWVAGSNKHGQLGLGKRSARSADSFVRNPYFDGVHASSAALGQESSLVLSSDGGLFTFGRDEHPILGHGGDKKTQSFLMRVVTRAGLEGHVPRRVRALDAVKVAHVAAGHTHAGCVDEAGQVFAWGSGSFWKLGTDKDTDVLTPTLIDIQPAVKKLALGGSHSLALTEAGQVLCWGANEHGCLGLGRKGAPSVVRTPLAIGISAGAKKTEGGEGGAGQAFVADIACGWMHSAAVGHDGKLLTWGWGGSTGQSEMNDSGGQLGHDNNFDYFEPSQAFLPPPQQGRKWSAVQVSCGFNHTACVISHD